MEPVTIQIPETIEEVKSRLGGIERLLTAKGWERAAIVYAFTYEPGKGSHWAVKRGEVEVKTDLYLCADFGNLGIHGLSSAVTVRDHRRVWQEAIDKGEAVDPRPGDVVELPSREYPSVRTTRLDDNFRPSTPPEVKYEAIRTIIRDEPEIAERIENDFIQKAGRDPGLAARIDRVYEEHHPVPEPRDRAFGDMERQRLFGFGVAIYSAIQREQDRVAGLLGYLESHGVDERDREAVDRLIESLAKSRQLLVDIEDRVNKAAGNDYDEVFRRLVNG